MVQGEVEPIRLARPEVGVDELAAVAAVIESGMLTMGPLLEEFERVLARACEVRHALAVSSGTAALNLAVLALARQLRPRICLRVSDQGGRILIAAALPLSCPICVRPG